MGFKQQIQAWLGISEAPGAPSGGGRSLKRDPSQSIIKKIGLAMTSGGGGRDFEPPEFDLTQIQNAYNTEAYVRIAIDKYIELMFKAGWQLVGKNPNTVDYIKMRLAVIAEATQIPTKQLLIEMAEDLVKYSNCVVAKARVDGYPWPQGINVQGVGGIAPVTGYFPLNLLSMSMKRDKFGTVKGWQQEVAGQDKPVKYKPEDIVHIYYRREKGMGFGQSFLFPVLDDIRALRQAEENVLRLIYRNLYPFHHIQVGTQDIPAEETEVADVKTEIETMDLEAGLITSERVNIKPVASDQIINAEPYLKYFEQRVFTGLGVPETMMGRGGAANRATSDNMSTDFTDRCIAMQTVLSAFITENMIKELLMEGGFDPVLSPDDAVEFVFNEIDLENRIKKENQAVYLYEHNSISQDEMRKLLGYDPVTDDGLMFLNLVSIPLAQAQAAARAQAMGQSGGGTPATNNKVNPTNKKKATTKPGSNAAKKPVKSSLETKLLNEFYLLGEGLRILSTEYFESDSKPNKRNKGAVLKEITLITAYTEERLKEVMLEELGAVSGKTGVAIKRLMSQVHDQTTEMLLEMSGSNRVGETIETINALFSVLESRLLDIAGVEVGKEEVDGIE